MPAAETAVRLYVQLAEAYQGLGRFQERDRFLMLAADTAWSQGNTDEAEALRCRILEYNPNHLLKPYPTFGDALRSTDMMAYIQQLRRGYPRERAEDLLKGLKPEAKIKSAAEDDMSLPLDVGGTLKPHSAPPVFTDFANETPTMPVRKPVVTMPPKREPAPIPRSPGTIPLRDEGRSPARLPPSQQIVSQRPAARLQPAMAAHVEATSGPAYEPNPASAAVGGLLFCVVLAAALAVVGYLFVLPLMT